MKQLLQPWALHFTDEHHISEPRNGVLQACFFGLNTPYASTLALMHSLHAQVAKAEIPEQLMLLEHEPTITITRQHLYKSLKTSKETIIASGIALIEADRGGDATFHGPGQLVGYPIISLARRDRFIDLSGYIRSLEQGLLNAMHALGLLSAELIPGYTGIWLKIIDENKKLHLRKLIAIGVGVKDGTSKHGFALNIDIDHQRYAEHITPCGLKDRGVITLKEAFYQKRLEMPCYSDIVNTTARCLSEIFSLTLAWRN